MFNHLTYSFSDGELGACGQDTSLPLGAREEHGVELRVLLHDQRVEYGRSGGDFVQDGKRMFVEKVSGSIITPSQARDQDDDGERPGARTR
jgi:hypothetical protein